MPFRNLIVLALLASLTCCATTRTYDAHDRRLEVADSRLDAAIHRVALIEDEAECDAILGDLQKINNAMLAARLTIVSDEVAAEDDFESEIGARLNEIEAALARADQRIERAR